MVKTYAKTLRRMFKANIVRFIAISMIIAIGIALVTGIGTLPLQIRDSLVSAAFAPEQRAAVNELADKVELISFIFPTFFIAVSALTALTTMTRLVDEERPVFACFKTLGYSGFSIVFRYVLFAVVCAAAGCVIGLAVGNFLLRPVMFNTVQTKFNLPDAEKILYLSQGLIWSAVMSAAVALTALSVGWRRCREKPAELLRPKAPKAGKKIFLEKMPFFWKRLKFKFKSSVRNILRFKGRLIMTVLSVMGSTVMLFCGIGLFGSINSDKNQNIQDLAAFTESMSVIAAAIILFAAALTVLVLFNLTNINIEERKKEIATLKVLGYNQIEVAGFIYREIMILSVIGIAAGLPSGYFFLGFIFDYIDFGSLDLVKWHVWVLTVVAAALSVLIADVLLYRKIKRIEMHTSLKTVE